MYSDLVGGIPIGLSYVSIGHDIGHWLRIADSFAGLVDNTIGLLVSFLVLYSDTITDLSAVSKYFACRRFRRIIDSHSRLG